jgi:hypothetical protein
VPQKLREQHISRMRPVSLVSDTKGSSEMNTGDQMLAVASLFNRVLGPAAIMEFDRMGEEELESMSEDHTLKSFTVKEQQIQGMSGRQ